MELKLYDWTEDITEEDEERWEAYWLGRGHGYEDAESGPVLLTVLMVIIYGVGIGIGIGWGVWG